jgi:hypothetical protein
MASQQTGFRPGSKTLAPQPFSPPLAGKKVVPPDPQDIWCEIKDKLTAVTDLFNFYDSLEFYDKPVSMRKGTLGGVIRILDDCIDKLSPLF